MTYNERLTEIAEKMAKEFISTNAYFALCTYAQIGLEKWENMDAEAQQVLIKWVIPLAKVCLEEKAKEFKNGHATGRLFPNTKYDLKFLGLIP